MFLLFKKGYDPLTFEKELTLITGSITSTLEQIYRLRRRGRSARRTAVHYLLVIYVVCNLYNYTQIPPVLGTRTRFQGVVRGLSRNQWLFVLLFPVFLVFLVRLLTGFYDWLVTSRQSKLRHLQLKHKLKIEELKKITNFNTTSELLNKYGDPIERKRKPTEVAAEATSSGARKLSSNGQTIQRTRVNPGTINVPQQLQQLQQPQQPQQPQGHIPPSSQTPAVSQPQQAKPFQRSLQDKLLDMLVGSDSSDTVEARYALICSSCFKHNGLAPPGCKEPHKVPYVCPNCGVFNGEFQLPHPEDLGENILIPEQPQAHRTPSPLPAPLVAEQNSEDKDEPDIATESVSSAVEQPQ